MSKQYDQYLAKHIENVKKGFDWFRENIPEIVAECFSTRSGFNLEWIIYNTHDASKTTNPVEYNAYDAYFYGGNKSFSVVQAFQRAWLIHIHSNPHHWQHWVLINDNPEEGEIIIEMPKHYIFEMICDWWSFSWEKGNLEEIFSWYAKHKDYIKFHPNTRKTVEDILDKMAAILKEV